VADAWESAMGLSPESTAVESTASAWAVGDDEIWIGAGRGASGVDFTRSNDASSSSWTKWAASFLGFCGHSQAQWSVCPHRRH
jgi:hypothetical protein